MAKKRWEELTPERRKKLLAGGDSKRLHNRNWLALSKQTRQRYERAGITGKLYNSGADLRDARGHGRAIDPITEPGEYKTIKRYKSRKKWAHAALSEEAQSAGKTAAKEDPFWVIFS